ncbi:hypothetical protein LP419_09410 [Massilia sp. H-1]|nr:hypothetical protein LP419_09410 [Massilia sp. H-1]
MHCRGGPGTGNFAALDVQADRGLRTGATPRCHRTRRIACGIRAQRLSNLEACAAILRTPGEALRRRLRALGLRPEVVPG